MSQSKTTNFQEITEIRSVFSATIDQSSNRVILIVDPLNNTDPKHMGTRQEIRVFDLPNLHLSKIGEGAYATRKISNALPETVSGFAYVFSNQALWSVDLSSLSMQFLTQGLTNDAQRAIGVHDPQHDVLYLTGQDSFNADILRISRTSGEITGAVRLPTPITAHHFMMDATKHKLVTMGSIDKRTSSASLFTVDTETFRVIQNETLIGTQTDYEGITADVDIENRKVFVSDAAGSLYSVDLENFTEQQRIYSKLGHSKQMKMVLAQGVLYFFSPDGTLLSVTQTGEVNANKILEPIEIISSLFYCHGSNALLIVYSAQEKWFLALHHLSS
eukprot:TRINITY_DN8087_c0_g1_i1.p1 TRINITY_DN8087_c0_g1~~TRINITY_DN8087_c0_g1_i1.p1  ORF type:complete len:338 (+),score=46.03 TRINITY_DN8087_c0_g1_i1:22-1014(+)